MITKTLLGILLTLTVSSQAEVNIVDRQYDKITGEFTLKVESTEHWVVWRTHNLRNWKRVSKVLEPNVTEWKDTKAQKYAFYIAISKKHPNPNGKREMKGIINRPLPR